MAAEEIMAEALLACGSYKPFLIFTWFVWKAVKYLLRIMEMRTLHKSVS